MGDPTFVGRKSELARLEAIWEQTERGDRQAVFLGGEPGSGKSRIAAELGRALHAHSVLVLLGSTSPDLSYPYGPLVEALDQLLVSTEMGALSELIPDSARELMRMTPNISRHRPDLPVPDSRQVENRLELFSAYSELISSLAREHPVALILEDLHWASAPTILLVSHLVDSVRDLPLLVLATMRNTPPDRSDNLSYAIADLHRLPGVTRLDLTGLEFEEIEEYLLAEGGKDLTHLRESAAMLKAQTGGNPLFLREVWREMSRNGGFAAMKDRRLGAPQTVMDTLERRLGSLSPTSRDILNHAAVLGATFEVSDLVQGVEGQGEEVLVGLDEAAAAGLVETSTTGQCSFQHDLVRQAILQGLTASRAASAHLRLARSIEAHYDAESAPAPLLARLYKGARPLGYEDKAVHFLSLAAEMASKGLAHEEAAQLREEAARMVTRDRARKDELLLAAARSHLLAGDFSEARALYRELENSSDAATAIRAAVGFEEASWRPGALGHDARAFLESTMERFDPDPSDPLYVRALSALGRSYTFSGDIAQAEATSHRALELAREIGDPELIADALVASLLSVMTETKADGEKHQAALELRSIALRTGDYDRLGPASSYKAYAAYLTSDYPAWQEASKDISLTAEKTGQPFWRWVDGCHRHCYQFMIGDFAAAAETAKDMNELGYSFGGEDTEGPFGLQMYMVRRETGGLKAVRHLITGDPSRDGTWLPGLLSLYTELDMRPQVENLLPKAMTLLKQTTNRTATHPAILAFTVEAALYLNDTQAMPELIPLMADYDGLNLMIGQHVAVMGSGNRYLGRMETALGNLDSADRHFRQSLKMDVEIGSIVHQTETLAHYSSMLDQVGAPEQADSFRTKAREMAESIGQTRVLELLERNEGNTFPDGLTQREVQVLRLLARGASNKEIGEELFISQNTAANHVRSILIKTGNPNRTAAAIYASQRDLL